ncbi:MAG: electron transport complex subunit RsxC [Clostridiales bacterium]|jgi:electron transport complex protein RnfC|nr:electron transport complex subunit RsxC [Clostridiales bacterium]
MSLLTFKRGVHPPDNKWITMDKPIVTIPPENGALMAYPVSQHLGAPCKPIVEVGERVLMYQKIADTDAFVSAPVHSSVSGTVKEIRKTLTPNGTFSDAIIIENDGGNEKYVNSAEAGAATNEGLLKIIREAGIVGLGGAGFPTHVKLNPPKGSVIDTVVVNAAECEPYLTTDYRVMMEDSKALVEGLQIILKLFPSAKGIIGIETNKMKAIEILESLCNGIPEISVARLKPKFPQGSEKQLISACTNREVPSGGLPAHVGVIVDNVDTVMAVQRAVVHNMPLVRRVITLSGSCFNNPGNYRARIGLSYRALIDAAGGFKEEPAKIISGGPMMGVAMYDLDIPIIKTSSAILAFNKEEAVLPEERNCIRCAKCVDHCPMGLMPVELNKNAIYKDEVLFKKYNGLDCVECGSCSYICPAKRHLAQSIRSFKRAILSKPKS